MNDPIRVLSERKYLTIVKLEQTTDGNYCYVAFHPELPGAMSQGGTPEEAEANLAEARWMVIEHLLANSLPVPDPFQFTATSSETRLPGPDMESESRLSTLGRDEFLPLEGSRLNKRVVSFPIPMTV